MSHKTTWFNTARDAVPKFEHSHSQRRLAACDNLYSPTKAREKNKQK